MASSSSPLSDVVQISLPLAIAQIYKLKLVSDYGTTRSRGRKRGKGGKGGTVVNPSPLLADWRRVDCSDSFYERKFSVEELTSIVRVEMSRNGGRIERRDGGDNREDDGDGQRSSDNGNGNDKEKEVSYAVLGRNGDVKRVLMLDRQGKVFEIIDDDDDNSEDESVDEGPASIRLGLGDFIFYSLLVAKAALYSFTTFAACILVIMAGLGGTLILLSVYHSALPALPISIFFGVTFYLLTRLVIEPWIENVMLTPIYV